MLGRKNRQKKIKRVKGRRKKKNPELKWFYPTSVVCQKLRTRLEEQRKDAETIATDLARYTRSIRKASESTDKSVLSDHHNQLNHVIDWESIK